ncbi:MAG: UvrD-helicase domain-containing protein [Candidatus Omnitrophica bacterium]|jgi:ATP-dependent exoDNAse (exonuclease V) beta subunit|nr:UvrD-helicase domain-containing protein [Candidatus Omnitrophota bacterium]
MTTISKAQIYVVEASAGSGKTYALAKQYLRLLIGPGLKPGEIPLRSILAITFTNKAAVEMKERILEFLKKIAFNQFRDPGEKKEILSFLETGEEAAREKAFLVMDEIIRNYNFFQVQTIDSFINAILSGCAFKLNLSAGFKIKTNYDEYLSFCLDKLIDRAAGNNEVMAVFEGYLRQYLYLENKAGWLPKKDILDTLAKMLNDSNVYGKGFTGYSLKDKNSLFVARRNLIGLMTELRDNEPDGTNQSVFKAFRNKLDKYGESLNIEELSRSFIAKEFPIRKNYQAPEKTALLWARIRKEIGELFELEALALLNCYIDIFKLFYCELLSAAGKDDVVFLAELNRKARVLFDEQGITVPELYYRLATRFRHYLIDEFQDTSALQWKNLFLMVEEALSTGGSLFYVGDKKQAIFRFRGGDTRLFDGLQSQFQNFPVKRSYLSDNYRSCFAIVDFNNRVFSLDNLKRFLQEKDAQEETKKSGLTLTASEAADILAVFDCSAQKSQVKSSGYVRIERVDAQAGEDTGDIIRVKCVELIRELSARLNGYRNIAILCRTNRQIEEITSWLGLEHIPVESEKTLNIRSHGLIKEIISFLKFLNSPIDDLSFASFILGDIFTRAGGISKEEISGFIFSAHRDRQSKARDVYLYREFRRRYPGIWDEFIEEFFKGVGFIPIYELVITIFSRFRITERFRDAQGFIMRFLEMIKNRVNEENASIGSFLEYFESGHNEDMYLNISSADAVKVMSVHKAKGLGFDAVIIPFLEINPEISAGQDKRPYAVYPEQGELRLLKLNKNYLQFSEFLAGVYRAEYRRSLIDELNNAYVAFTRARSELYCFIPPKSANSYNLANLLITEELLESGEKNRISREDANISVKTLDIPPLRYASWIPVLKDEFVQVSELDNRQRLREGEYSHAVLSYIPNLVDKDVSLQKALKMAIGKADPLFEDITDLVGLKKKIRLTLDSPGLAQFFREEGAKVYTEKEFVNAQGQTKRIDRMIVTANQVLLADYKSSKEERGSGIIQMREYIRMVKQLYPGKTVRGSLIYLSDATHEEVDG